MFAFRLIRRSMRPFKSLEIYNHSKKLVLACYELTQGLPEDEKTNFCGHIRKAALTVHLNIAQGAFLKSKKRKKFLKTAQNSLIIIDAATEILVEVGFVSQEDIDEVVRLSSFCYQLLDQL